MLKNQKWYEIRQELFKQSLDYSNVITEMDKIIFFSSSIPLEVKRKSNIMASKYLYEMNFSFDNEICFSAYMAEMQDILQW